MPVDGEGNGLELDGRYKIDHKNGKSWMSDCVGEFVFLFFVWRMLVRFIVMGRNTSLRRSFF